MEVKWPEPKPIAKATFENGRMLAWDGLKWHIVRWWEPDRRGLDGFWWAECCDNYADAKAMRSHMTHFLPMPPAPDTTTPKRCVWEYRTDRHGGFPYYRVGCGGEATGGFPETCPYCDGKVVKVFE